MGPALDAVGDVLPFCEAGEVLADAAAVGTEVVGAVGVVEDAIGVGAVEGVAADVVAFLDDDGAEAVSGAAFGEHEA